jgi:multidrug resistance efflux pump
MDTAFLRTLRSLDDDGSRRTVVGLAVAGALLVAWSAWFLLARVSRYEVTDMARVEIDRAIHPIQSEIAGRVRVSRLAMGNDVRAGDILVELETNSEQLRVGEERARLNALSPQLHAIREQLAAIDHTELREREASRIAVDEARARFREADAIAGAAEDDVERLTSLRGSGLIPERDLGQGKAEAARRRAAADSLQFAVTRLASEQHTRESDREANRRRLRGDITRIEGDRTTASATLERLDYETERRLVRAPVSGRVGEAQVLRAGTYVREGEVLGAVVPFGGLRIVADFAPSSAIGRIHPGQRAKLRLHGFPWAEYGSVPAKVCAVAGEIRNGHVRIELNLLATNSVRVPLQHGLPGAVEVEVERVTPMRLVFRAAGQLLSSSIADADGARP